VLVRLHIPRKHWEYFCATLYQWVPGSSPWGVPLRSPQQRTSRAVRVSYLFEGRGPIPSETPPSVSLGAVSVGYAIMTSVTWTPRRADSETHHTLVDGVPSYMLSPLRDWFVVEFMSKDGYGYSTIDSVRMQRRDLAARSDPLVDQLLQHGSALIFKHLDDESKLDIVDWLIFDNEAGKRPTQNRYLESILASGGSVWKVGVRDGVAGLERRVPEGVQVAAEAAISTPGDAGRLLSEAWHAVYGMSPKPDEGYRKSIEAVEAVVLPHVTGNDGTAHLGKAIGQMRAEGDWKMPFVKEHKENPSQGVVLGMMQALWSGHSDRHPGTSTYIQSTQEAAEAAVSLAVTLVNLFASGGIVRRP